MLDIALAFLVLAFVASIFGFGGIAGVATAVAQILFFVFIAMFLISYLVPRMKPPIR